MTVWTVLLVVLGAVSILKDSSCCSKLRLMRACLDSKILFTALLLVVGCGGTLTSHLNDGTMYRETLLTGGTAYGLPFGNLTHGTSIVEHIAITHFAGAFTQIQLLLQFFASLVVDFRHCILVAVLCHLTNVAIMCSGTYVDFDSPVQKFSAGIGVQTAIVTRSVWSLLMMIIGLMISYQLDRERRVMWLQSQSKSACLEDGAAQLSAVSTIKGIEAPPTKLESIQMAEC